MSSSIHHGRLDLCSEAGVWPHGDERSWPERARATSVSGGRNRRAEWDFDWATGSTAVVRRMHRDKVSRSIATSSGRGLQTGDVNVDMPLHTVEHALAGRLIAVRLNPSRERSASLDTPPPVAAEPISPAPPADLASECLLKILKGDSCRATDGGQRLSSYSRSDKWHRLHVI
jgi:hypothetical protein